ncbi:MAG: hypothetical protein OEY01_11130 [Desulfobulbaceae bacterium]|nr:hypothetical protein [Desulfobulbaceae bacterium]
MPVQEYEITGATELQQIFAQLPLKYGKKPIQAAFRKGARIFTTALKSNTPTASGETRRSIKVKALRGAAITVGFSGSKGNMPGYFKAYWSNYGTLALRNSAHKFKKSRKPKSAGWDGGIRAGGFVEESWEQTKNQVEQKITAEIETETRKFLNKYAVK